MKIGIGIDTGGTYTDAIVYDFETKSVLGSAKALTTKEDLSMGILAALDQLPAKYLPLAEVVSLSTTLATNACVENKGGRAKLIFFGTDENTINKYGGSYGLPPSDDINIQPKGNDFSDELTCEPDWDAFVNSLDDNYKHLDGVAIIEMNAMKNNAAVEKRAKKIFQERYDIPVVCGHELFSELNSLQRGASVLLNAGLFPTIADFLKAIKRAMKQRNMKAKIIMVRSDGSLMSEEFANLHPVETLLCGPAASVLGSSFLTDEKNNIVVDMGGTTTDIAMVKNDQPVKVVNGVNIGKWKTFVDGIYIKTFGLGGDSAIHYVDKKVYLEDYRIVPLCVAAHKYPIIKKNLKKLEGMNHVHSMFLYEHYILVRDIGESSQYTEEEIAICKALKDGPLICRDLAKAVDKDIYNLKVARLIKEGIIQIVGLTPTDIMHIKGDFNNFDAEAALLGAGFIARNVEMKVEELCDFVYAEIKRKIYLNIVKAMLENEYPEYMRNGINENIERFIDESFTMAFSGKKSDLMTMKFSSKYVLQGIGAPIHIFLEDVAKLLGTKARIPKFHEVANALGAVVGNIYASCVVEIKANWDEVGVSEYIVYGKDENKSFKELEEAEKYAASQAKKGAKEIAISRGAKGKITVTCEKNMKSAKARNSPIFLGETVTAFAAGSMGF